MGTASAQVRTLPTGRAFFADEQDTFLRATWHGDRGFVNLSLWRDAVCVGTFHLPIADSARLAAFLVEGLGEAAAALLENPRAVPPVRLAPPVGAPGAGAPWSAAASAVGRRVADLLRRPADGRPPHR
jgi:hypothetical protein